MAETAAMNVMAGETVQGEVNGAPVALAMSPATKFGLSFNPDAIGTLPQESEASPKQYGERTERRLLTAKRAIASAFVAASLVGAMGAEGGCGAKNPHETIDCSEASNKYGEPVAVTDAGYTKVDAEVTWRKPPVKLGYFKRVERKGEDRIVHSDSRSGGSVMAWGKDYPFAKGKVTVEATNGRLKGPRIRVHC